MALLGPRQVGKTTLARAAAARYPGTYRTAAGAEIDLVIEHRLCKIGVEIKFSSAPKPAKVDLSAADDLAYSFGLRLRSQPRHRESSRAVLK